MKKGVLIFLSLLLFLLIVGGGFAYFYFTPRGILRSDTPENVMQSCLDRMDTAAWREEYCRCCAPSVTAFEDAGTVAGHIFDAMPQGAYAFREDSAGENEIDYIISRGNTDFLRMRTVYESGKWQTPAAVSAAYLTGEPHSLTITVPEGSSVTVNGSGVGSEYIDSENVPYPDMTELELRFSAVPHRVRYRIDGLYENASVEASHDAGLVLLSGGMTDWEYTLSSGGDHAFHVTAPAEAIVTVNGTELTETDAAASTVMPVSVSIPENVFPLLPGYRIYTAGGLYSVPEISAVLPDGTVLESASEEVGYYSFVLPADTALESECSERIISFIKCLLHYGAGHTGDYSPYGYMAEESELYGYCSRAAGSLYWTVGFTLSFQDVTVRDFIPLGNDAFLCRAHADYTTQSRHETREISQEYQMLWLRQGDTWKIYDLAFM